MTGTHYCDKPNFFLVNMTNSGIIFNIQRFSVNDGPGIRTTVFMKGCPMGCQWCHNPESRSFGIEKINGQVIGKEYTVDALFEEIEKDRIFYDESGGGVTFSGGEPLSQPEFLINILNKCRDAGIHCAIDTAGYAKKEILNELIGITDLFLYDIKLIDPVQHLKYTNVSNHEILENLEYLVKNKVKIIVRLPLIPEITATDKNIEQIRDFLKKYKKTPEINLLPYHRIAENKYKKYGFKYMMINKKELDNAEIEHFRKILINSRLNVNIEGN